MSRVRMAYVLALFGILITTGGCAESATAPEATSVGAGISARRDAAPSDSVIISSPGDGDATTMGGVILVGGERVSEP